MLKKIKLICFGTILLLGACTPLEEVKTKTTVSTVEKNLVNGSPWITTAVYKEVNGKMDTSKNYIDTEIANGTISSAQYKNNKFIFVFLKDYTTGEFNLPEISENIKNINKDDKASGFVYGDLKIVELNGEVVRELHNPSFNTNIVIKRVISEVNKNIFTYKFEKDGSTYYVEHRPYKDVFSNKKYPTELQEAVDKFLWSK